MRSSAKLRNRLWLPAVLLIWITVSNHPAIAGGGEVISKANILVHSGRQKQAEVLLRGAVAGDPDSAELHGALGRLLFNQRRYPEAVEEMNYASQLAPTSREYNMLLVASLLGAKRFSVALKFLKQIQPQFGQYAEFHYSLGLAYYNLWQLVQAQEELEESLRLDSKLEQARLLLATCAAAAGNNDKAATILRQLVAEHPRSSVYWAALAEALRPMGDDTRPEALRACRNALAISPSDLHAKFVLATILLDAGDFAGARPLLERLVQLSPQELEAHALLARVYGRLGYPALARKESEILKRLQDSESRHQVGQP